MHIQTLTRRVLTPLQLFFVLIFTVLDADAKPVALNVGEENSLDNEQTLPAAKLTMLEDGVYKCNHHHQIDKNHHHHRKRRYTATPFKFHTMVVLWHVTKFSLKLPTNVQLKVFTEAFDKWHVVSRLNFSYTANASAAHIKISFLKNHFHDGPGGILAHAFDPHSSNGFPGEIHFDEDENWVTTTTGGVNLRALALHEIGHAIGIKHSHAAQAIMKAVILNNGTELFPDDIAAIRWMYGKCEVRDITAVLHDRYANHSDTVLVINKDKIWRIRTHDGEIENEINEKWPKDVRDYYRVTNPMYDKVFPLRAAMYIPYDNDVYLFGQQHFIRKKPWENHQMTGGRFYDFKDHMKFHDIGWWTGYLKRPEGPLPYSKENIIHTPEIYKKFLISNRKFGASLEVDCCFWQHFFLDGIHYKISTHDFNDFKIEDMSIEFPGAPRNPDASWFDIKSKEWYFFKADRYYKKNNTGHYTDRGPISLLWFSVCD